MKFTANSSVRKDSHAQVGLTLVELIVALAIISLIGVGIAMAISQTLLASRQANEQQYAVSQVRQAEHFITRDAVMAWKITSSGFPLVMYWETVDTQGNTFSHTITYTLSESPDITYRLQRNNLVVLKETDDVFDRSTQFVADSLHGDSACEFDSQVLTVTLKAQMDYASEPALEVREFQVSPRKSDAGILTEVEDP